jgi:hypothetical protein
MVMRLNKELGLPLDKAMMDVINHENFQKGNSAWKMLTRIMHISINLT